MKKKGFTLIEIIVCIIILAIIGVSSFVGIKTLTKNIKIDNLEQITDRALQAAEVYIENNNEMKKQLFTNKNTVVVPLNVLLSEGLLDLKGTTLEDKDIENEYVVTAFTGNNPKENCIDITSNASWNLSKDNPFYICSNESGTSNSIIIGGTTNNKDTILKERTYLNDYSRNYVTYLGGTYRIMYIEPDDSLVLYTEEDTFGDKFIGKTQPIFAESEERDGYYSRYYEWDNDGSKLVYFASHSDCRDLTSPKEISEAVNNFGIEIKDLYKIYINKYAENSPYTIQRVKKVNSNNEQYLTNKDYTEMYNVNYILPLRSLYFGEKWTNKGETKYSCMTHIDVEDIVDGNKIQLKACIKVTTGIGTSKNPYILDDSSC